MKAKKARSKVEIVLHILVILALVRQLFLGNYHNVFLCVLTLALFAVPKILEHNLRVTIPTGLETVILLFIFSAEILGEINAFYVKIPIWDTMLHTVNGFLMAAVGFSLIDIFNRSERFTLKMSPYFVAFTAFCFSMTVGTVWEFFEFTMDSVFGTDMQKDWVVTTIHSVMLDPTASNKVVTLPVDALSINGEDWIAMYGGYIDIGLIDTMKDMLVNFLGAVVFSFIGVFYLKHRGNSKIAAALIPTVEEVADGADVGKG